MKKYLKILFITVLAIILFLVALFLFAWSGVLGNKPHKVANSFLGSIYNPGIVHGGQLSINSFDKPIELPTRKDYKSRETTERGKELGWVLGEVLIEFDDNEINLDNENGAKKALKLIEQVSNDIAPLVVKKMVEAGTLPQDYMNEKMISNLKEDLVQFGRTIGSNGAVLAVGIDESEDIISEELKKYEGVEDASPNYIGSFF